MDIVAAADAEHTAWIELLCALLKGKLPCNDAIEADMLLLDVETQNVVGLIRAWGEAKVRLNLSAFDHFSPNGVAGPVTP